MTSRTSDRPAYRVAQAGLVLPERCSQARSLGHHGSGRQSKGILSFCLSKDETHVSCGSRRASRMFSCIRQERPLLLPTCWLFLHSISSCGLRNTLLSDVNDLEQPIVPETLCPNLHPKSMFGEVSPMPCTAASAQSGCVPLVVSAGKLRSLVQGED